MLRGVTMSVYDTYADTPFQIKNDGQEITVRATRTSATTIRVSWNLPSTIQCGSSTVAYNGAIITIDQSATTLSKLPVDGTVYTADATADTNLNAGDRIGSALVIGAFYNDTTTTFFDITDAPESNAYYVSLHAADAQYRYHTDGVHSYSLPFNNGNTQVQTAAYQDIQIGSSQIYASSATNLSQTNTFTCEVQCDKNHTGYNLSVSGNAVATYGQLVNALNSAVIATLNPTMGTIVPGTGYYWYDGTTNSIKLWNGSNYVIQNALISNANPIAPNDGTFWYNTTTSQLLQYSATTSSWAPISFFNIEHDPRVPVCDDFWYKSDTNMMYRWTGVIWDTVPLFNQLTDPALAPVTTCASYWFNGTSLYNRSDIGCIWNLVPFVTYSSDFSVPTEGTLWINTTTSTLYKYTSGVWIVVSTVAAKPTLPVNGMIFFDTINDVVQSYSTSTGWTICEAVVYPIEPQLVTGGTIWHSTTGFNIWDSTSAGWTILPVTTSTLDPALPPVLNQDSVWYDNIIGTFSKLEGTSWIDITAVTVASAVKPQNITSMIWYSPLLNTFQSLANNVFTTITPTLATYLPSAISIGQLWYSVQIGTLSQWTGTVWSAITVSTIPFTLPSGTYFYNTSSNVLMLWNGNGWTITQPNITFEITSRGYIRVSSTTVGSTSWVRISNQGLLFNAISFGVAVTVHFPMKGTDPLSTVPSYMQQGVGTDGSQDERRNLVSQLKMLLGYPSVEVELTKEQMDVAIDNSLMELRYKSGVGYKRGMFFMDVLPHVQQYYLTDATVGFNKVVDVLYLHRMTSAYLGTGVGAGVYGQIAIQQLYTYGKFDLVSFHLVAGYIELMKQMFATEIQFAWDEYTRKLSIYKDFWIPERVLVDAVLEKTEQELMTDRWCAKWIQKYALAQCRLMLAEVRGKYTSINAAGGSVSMNASDLRATAEREMSECQADIDDYIVSNKFEWGSGSDFICG